MAQEQLESHRQVALMLCESLLHELVESGVIAKAQALDVVDTVVELAHEAAGSDRPLGSGSGSRARSATVIIEAIRRRFVKGAS